MTDPYDKHGPGRPPKVTFPIIRIEVVHGVDYIRRVEENTTVKCVHCGQQFLINGDTAFRLRRSIDDTPYIRCPHCSSVAAVCYYYDQVKERRARNVPED